MSKSLSFGLVSCKLVRVEMIYSSKCNVLIEMLDLEIAGAFGGSKIVSILEGSSLDL